MSKKPTKPKLKLNLTGTRKAGSKNGATKDTREGEQSADPTTGHSAPSSVSQDQTGDTSTPTDTPGSTASTNDLDMSVTPAAPEHDTIEGKQRSDPTKPVLSVVVKPTVTTGAQTGVPTTDMLENQGRTDPCEARPKCVGYVPSHATGRCRCEVCKTLPFTLRVVRPFVVAPSAGLSTSGAQKQRTPSSVKSSLRKR